MFAADFTSPVRMNWIGMRDTVLYRQAVLSAKRHGTPPVIDLADITLEKWDPAHRLARLYLPGQLRLGHYALPHVAGRAEVEERRIRGCRALIARIPGRQVTMVAVAGWDRVFAVSHRGFHPEADESTLLLAEREDDKDFPPHRGLSSPCCCIGRTTPSGWTKN